MIDDYLNLVPSANRQQPRFIAELRTVLGGMIAAMSVAGGLPRAFDLDEAIGVQLDAVGVRVGLSRRLPVPIAGVYFSFDIEGVGFDQGVWKGPFDPDSGLVDLDDETYRLALRIKIAANTWDGSLEGAQRVLGALVSSGTALFVQDNFDMTMTVGVSGNIPSTLFTSILRTIVQFVKPLTVGLDVVIVTSVDGAPIFGFDTDNAYLGGFDRGAWAMNY